MIRWLILVVVLSSCQSVRSPAHSVVFTEQKQTRVSDVPLTVPRPELHIHQLSPVQRRDNALLVKAYVASVLQLIHYATALEQVVAQLQTQYSVFDADPYFDLEPTP